MHNVNDYNKGNLTQVTEKAGVSIATVSRVINNNPHVNPKTCIKVENATKTLKYKTNKIATRLRINDASSNLPGVLIPYIQNPFYVESLIHS